MKGEVISQAGRAAIRITSMFQRDCESNATERIFHGTRD